MIKRFTINTNEKEWHIGIKSSTNISCMKDEDAKYFGFETANDLLAFLDRESLILEASTIKYAIAMGEATNLAEVQKIIDELNRKAKQNSLPRKLSLC